MNLITYSTYADDSQPVITNLTTDWSKADEFSISCYQFALNSALSHVNIPTNLLVSDLNDCTINVDKLISDYYNDVISCIIDATSKCIPNKTITFRDFVIPGWNEHVSSKHKSARVAFLEWVGCGKPRFGPAFEQMKKSRSQFKLALRYCKQHEDISRADAYAKSLADFDYKNFWKYISRNNNSTARQHSNIIDGCVGENNIVERWRTYYENLYNKDDFTDSKNKFFNDFDKIDSTCADVKFLFMI